MPATLPVYGQTDPDIVYQNDLTVDAINQQGLGVYVSRATGYDHTASGVDVADKFGLQINIDAGDRAALISNGFFHLLVDTGWLDRNTVLGKDRYLTSFAGGSYVERLDPQNTHRMFFGQANTPTPPLISISSVGKGAQTLFAGSWFGTESMILVDYLPVSRVTDRDLTDNINADRFYIAGLTSLEDFGPNGYRVKEFEMYKRGFALTSDTADSLGIFGDSFITQGGIGTWKDSGSNDLPWYPGPGLDSDQINPASSTYTGDSALVPSLFRECYREGIALHNNGNRAVAGGTMTQVISQYDAMVNTDGLVPKIVFINCGTNEAAGGQTVAQYGANLRTALTNMNAAGTLEVIIQETLSLQNDLTYDTQARRDKVDQINAENDAVIVWLKAQGFTLRARVNRVFTFFGGHTPNVAFYQGSNIHPNELGSYHLGTIGGQDVAVSARIIDGFLAYVTDVTDETQAAAVTALEADGFVVGTISNANSPTIASGNVISTTPAADEIVDDGTTVAMLVSNGPATVSVPDVVDQVQATAESNIVAANLVVGTVTSQSHPTIVSGNVISQNPASGSTVAEQSSVDLVVSTGTGTATVPNVVGQAQATAQTNITNAGFVVGTVTTQSSLVVNAGNVISQNPASGSTETVGTDVDLVVSSGPAQLTVPDVVDVSQAAAQTAITNAGFTVGTITTATSSTIAAGNVISQSPAAASVANEQSAINLVVSTGVDTVSVPDVVGSTQTVAVTDIVAAGLVSGVVTFAASETVVAGLVISQDPNANDVVAIGSSVDYVISTGPVPDSVYTQEVEPIRGRLNIHQNSDNILVFRALSAGTPIDITGFTGHLLLSSSRYSEGPFLIKDATIFDAENGIFHVSIGEDDTNRTGSDVYQFSMTDSQGSDTPLYKGEVTWISGL